MTHDVPNAACYDMRVLTENIAMVVLIVVNVMMLEIQNSMTCSPFT